MLAGKDITDIPPYKRDIAMVFQNYALFPHMTVFDNVTYGLKNRGIKDKAELAGRVAEVLAMVQLEGVEKRYPAQLSGGQQQRVSLARALAVKPQIMLFDEPLSNLDAKLRVATRIEIRNLLKEQKITALYVTHDQEEALTLSDLIAVMNGGKIEQIDVPVQLYNHPKTNFVADFIGHANILEGEVLACSNGVMTVQIGSSVVHCRTPHTADPGSKESFLLRPENIDVVGEEQAVENGIPGVVTERNFIGSIVRFKVLLLGGREVEIEAHPDKAGAAIGDHVKISFSEEKLIHIG